MHLTKGGQIVGVGLRPTSPPAVENELALALNASCRETRPARDHLRLKYGRLALRRGIFSLMSVRRAMQSRMRETRGKRGYKHPAKTLIVNNAHKDQARQTSSLRN